MESAPDSSSPSAGTRTRHAPASMGGRGGLQVHTTPKPSHTVRVVGAWRVLVVEEGGPDVKLAAITRAQRGLASRSQLLELGITEMQIRVRMERRQLRRVHRGVYAVGDGAQPELFRETAAILACGPGTALSHRTALCHLGMLDAAASGPVEVTVVQGGSRTQPGIQVHRSRTVRAQDVRLVRGLPVTTAERTLLDSAPLLSERQLERALDEAIALRLTSQTKLTGLLAKSHGHPGRGRLAALAAAREGLTITESDAEELFLELVRKAGLPMPQIQAPLYGYEIDAYWPEARFAVEIDSFKWHTTKTKFERDRRKQQVLQQHDIELSHVTWHQMTVGALSLVAHLAARTARRWS